VPESERSKSLAQAERLISRLSRAPRMRAPVLLAFGGGVVGDLTGFVAAVLRRGVPYVQVPTTLLAQVDSAVGGKVGVDVPHAKNMIGAFHQPRLVYNNLSVLASLPPRQRRSGLAEIIKCGVIADPALFRYVERHLGACLALRRAAVRTLVARACRVKARVVGRDERETTGVRAQLNFGHTIGHALEAATGYRRWTHGEAISIGMCAAASMAARAGRTTPAVAARIESLLAAAGLPTHARGVPVATVRKALRYDKKFIRGRPRWVLPLGIGRVIVTEDVPARIVDEVLAEYVRR
jgi:3-dehydroquinate synthase